MKGRERERERERENERKGTMDPTDCLLTFTRGFFMLFWNSSWSILTAADPDDLTMFVTYTQLRTLPTVRRWGVAQSEMGVAEALDE